MNLSGLISFTLSISVALGQNKTYVISSELSSMEAPHSSCPDDVIQCLTLNELTDSVPQAFQSQEVVFESGVHVVNETKRQNLTFSHVRNLTMRGESSNVTITCLLDFHVVFEHVANIRISNLTFCSCMSNILYYDQHTWNYNVTLLFTNIIHIQLDSIQLISDSNDSIAIHTGGGHIILTNSRIEYGGMFVGFYDLDKSTVEISNSWFITSCVEFKTVPTNTSEVVTNIAIKNTTFEDECIKHHCWSVLSFNRALNVTLVDVNILNSTPSFLMYVKQMIFIHFKGNISFHNNKGVVYIKKSEILFSGAQVSFVNNTVVNTLGAPIYAVDSSIILEQCHVVFKSNYGLLCGGITGRHMKLLIKDNSTVDFISNKGQNGGALSLFCLLYTSDAADE